jgi:ABC-type phosphate transport system substrate-binding protein
MFVRKALAGAVTLAVTGSALALTSGAAHAAVQPDDTTFAPTLTDIVGGGSDTSQNATFRLAQSFNATVPAGQPRLATFAATGGGEIPLPNGSLTRPNGSGGGKSLLHGTGNRADVDYARSSSSLNDTERNAGLRQFPFALDTLKLAVSGDVVSNAPATITPAQMVGIYNGSIDDWSDIGGQPGAIAPKIPQGGSGTRSFFEAQLRAANSNNPVTLADTVKEVQEHDATPVRGDANAVAPFSSGRAGLLGTALRLPGGFTADRALYNVVRSADLGNATIQSLFGPSGFFCSDGANDEIKAAGFEQLDSVADGGVCGQATDVATSNFKLNEEVAPIATTVTVTGTSPSARAVRLTARVAATPTPTGTVQFVDDATDAAIGGPVNLIGGTATLTLGGRAPGAYSVSAIYTPDPETTFVASQGTGTARVKAASSIRETFPASVKKKAASAKGVVTVAFSGLSTKPTGKVVIKKGAKTVGTGVLKAGKATITLAKAKVGTGKSTLRITYAGNANGFGSTRAFTITFKK